MSPFDRQRVTPFTPGIPNARLQERHLSLNSAGVEFATNPRWQSFTAANKLLNAAAMLKCGNIVLPYGAPINFRTLALLVGDLRSMGNDGLRIVVREQGKSLRLSQSTALMKLGVSLILPKALDPALVRQSIVGLEGTRYQGKFRRDVEEVLRQARQMQTVQRMTEEEFRTHAQCVLGAGFSPLPHTLVVLHPLTARESKDIDTALSTGLRDGVYTVQPEGIWLLLMACKPFDCQPVLERVIGSQFENLLIGWRNIGNSIDILSAIYAMHENFDDIEFATA